MQLIDSCPLCGETDLRELFSARDPHYGIPGEYRIVRCAGCGLQFVNPMYSDEELAALYPSDYYAYNDPPKASRWKLNAKKLLGYWQGTKEPKFEKPGRFLDIGCGTGEVVARMDALRWDSQGVEINSQAAMKGRSRGLQISTGSIQDAKFTPESFDYIRASHSFEHVTRPHETLDEIHRILKTGGKLLIAVPNVNSLTARVFKRYWWHLCPPVHPFGYSVDTLSLMLRQHGFHVTEVVYNSDYVGVLGSLQIWLNRNNGKKSFDGPAFRNRPLRVLSGWIEKALDVTGLGDMIELHANKGENAVHPATSQSSSEVRAVA